MLQAALLTTALIGPAVGVVPIPIEEARAAAGTGLQLNGTNQRVTFGAAPGLGASTFTLEIWFMRTGAGLTTTTGTGGLPNPAVPLLSKGRGQAETPANLNMNYFLGIDSVTGTLVADFENNTGGGNHPISGTTFVTSNAWHHAAVTYGSGTWNLYLDGALDKTESEGAAVPEATSIQHAALGTAMTSIPAAEGHFAGVIDEARVWNGVRTQAQIRAAKDVEIGDDPALLGLWHLNEGTGTTTTADSSNSGNTGTLQGAPTWVEGFTAPTPPSESALELRQLALTPSVTNATYVTFGDPNELDLPVFTVETWFNRTGAGVAGTTGNGGIASFIPLVTHGGPEAENSVVDANWLLGINEGTTDFVAADFELEAGGANQPLVGTTPIAMNTWYHAAVTHDGTTMRLYLNGQLEAERAAGAPRDDTSQHAALGVMLTSTGANGNTARFHGALDEVRVWNGSRTRAQIRAEINSRLSTAPAGLVARWPVDETAGPTVSDSVTSPTASHGTIVNSPVARVAPAPFNLVFTDPPDAPVLVSPANGATGVATPPDLDVTVSDPNGGTLDVQFFGRPLASGTFAGIGSDFDVPSGDHATVSWSALSGGQTYEWFAIVDDGTTTTTGPTWTFHTAAGAGTVVIAVGDIASCTSSGDESTAAIMAGLDGGVITTGDNVYETGTAAEFTNCYEPSWGPYKARTRPIPGNHDWGNGVRTPASLTDYFAYFGANATDANGFSYYSYDLDTDWHVVNLDSECALVTGGCAAGSPQHTWLVADLAANADKNVIAVWHKPRFSSGTTNLIELQPFVDELYEAGVDLALVGHDHIYERFKEIDNTGAADPTFGFRHITVGTGGANHHTAGAQLPTSDVVNDDAFGVLKLVLHPTSYEWRFLPVAGQTFTDFGSEAVHDAPVPGENGLNLGTSGAYVTFGDPAKLDLAQFTIETWFMRTGAGVAGTTGNLGIPSFIPLVSHGGPQGDGSNIDANWLLGIEGTGSVLAADFEDMATGLNHPVLGTTVITSNVWHHAAATYDGTTWRLYLDGQLEVTEVESATPRSDTTQHAGLGVMLDATGGPANGSAARFAGTLDEVRVWNSAQSLAQIRAAVNEHPPVGTTGIVARWPMNEGGGGVGDTTASPANGTLVGVGATRVQGAPFDLVFDTTPPAAPTGLDATPGDGTVNLTWTANSEADLDGYHVFRSTTPSVPTTGTPLSGPTPVTSASYSDTTATNGTTYYYVVVAVDDSGNRSGPSNEVSETPQPGPGANGIDLGSAGAYVTFGNAAELDLGQFTVETWFKRTGEGTGGTTGMGGFSNFLPLIANGGPETDAVGGSNVDANWMLGIDNTSDVLAADFEEGSAGSSPGLNHPVSGVTPITNDVWHHAAATYDGTTWRLYLDGRLERTLFVGQPARSDTTQHAALGALLESDGLPNNTARFQGVLDETRVWSGARSQAQIRASINAELTSPPAGLVARWPMSEGGGSLVADAVPTPATNGSVVGTGTARIAGATFNITLDVAAPANPTGLAATAGSGSVALAWTANGDLDLAGYRVYRATSAGVPIDGAALSGPDPITSSAFTDTTAANGTTYFYVVVAVDTSGNGSGASNEVQATPQSTGGVSHALDLGGGYVTFGAAPGLGTSVFTIETWFRRDGTGTPAETSGGTGGLSAIPLVAKGRGEVDTPANLNMNWFLGIDAVTNTLAADFEDTASGLNHPIVGDTVISNGVWHHAAVTYDGTTWRLYLDGALEATEVVNATAEATSIQHASLGTAMDSAGVDQGRFDGALDEVRIWNFARSAAQIDSTKNIELTTGSGLIARWGMNETSTTTVNNSVGTLHGTIVGAAARIAGAPMPADPVLVGAGDIAVCGQSDDEATATLLAGIPGTVFTAGDNVYESGTAAEFTNCYNPSWGAHKARTMPAPGNHDYVTPGAAGYFGYFGAAAGDPSLGYYAYDRGSWRIYTLNSEITGTAMTTQASWLRTDLEASTGKNVMAIIHKPLFSSGNVHGNDPVSLPLWDVLHEFGAEIVVSGHEHTYERFAPQSPTGAADPAGIRLFIAGTGGRSHYGLATLKPNSQVFNGTTFGVLKVTLHDNSYSWEFVPVPGGTFTDSGVASTVDPVGDAAPAAPTGLAAVPGDNSVALTWNANTESDLAGYNIYRGLTTPNPATDTPLNGGTLLTSPSYLDTAAPNGATLHYVVTAVDDASHESAPSTEAIGTPFEPGPHALDFDGTNDHVTFGPAPQLGLTTFTLEAWVRRDGTGVGIPDVSGGLPDSVPLITKGRTEGETPATNMNWFLGLDEATGVLQADFEDDATAAAHPISGTTPMAVGTWYHVAATYDGTTWRLYVNGGLDATETEGATPENASTQHAALATAMNSTGAQAGRFNGVLDEVRIWNVARTQTQIQAAMGNELGSDPNLISRWAMNEGSGTSVSNSVPGGPNGTAVGGPPWVPGSPFVSSANASPAAPSSPNPADGATGIGTSPTLRVNVSDPDGDPLTTTFYGRAVASSPAEDFTVVVIPDTQHYVDSPVRAPLFTAQTNWIKDNVDDLNIAFVSHLGDIVENFNNVEVEWQRADASMDVLDDNGVPNNVTTGNHDMGAGEDFTFFDQYFPPSRYNKPENPWYGGWLGEESGQMQRLNKDNYELFSAGGIDFLIVHIEVDMPTYATAWANQIIDRYPDRTVILSTHSFVTTSNARATSTITGRPNAQTAATVWSNLVSPNCNVRFVVNGHYPGEGRVTTNNSCGQPVHQILTDYQSRSNGGDGWLRYYTFKPSENKVYAYTYSPTLGSFENDATSQFTLDFAMNGAAPFEALGTVNTPSGSTASIAWPGRATSTQYEWYASVSDGALTTVGPTNQFTTDTPGSNNPPIVINPGDQSDAEGAVVDLPIEATDPDSDTLTWSATGLPPGLSMNPGTGHVTGTVAANGANGSPHSVTVSVADGNGPPVPVAFTWTVTGANVEPTFDQDLPNRTDPEGTLVNLDAGATDPDGDSLTYAATGLPTGLSINTSTGLITGTLSSTAAANSPYSTSITVRDGPTVDATDTFTWTVTDLPAGSGIAFRAASFGSNNASTTSITLTRPSGTLAGDVLLAALGVRGTSTVTAPAGWTLIRTDTYTSSLRMHTYWRLATGSDPASWTWTFSGSRLAAGAIHAYSGVNTTSPIDASGGQAASTTSATATAPSITTTVANTRLVAFFANMSSSTWTAPTGFTERADLIGTSPSQFTSLVSADAPRPAAGATGALTATATASSGNVGQVIALRPA